MGIRGLSSYIAERSQFHQNIQLRDTKVIIDANNLRFDLYRCCRGLNDCFGGDYDKFYRYVANFCQILRKCKIIPVFVFDGGFEKDEKKMDTIIKRLNEHTKSAVNCNSVNQSKVRAFPIFASHVFLQAVQDVFKQDQVEIHQCSFEADEVLAHLAWKYNCPVIRYLLDLN